MFGLGGCFAAEPTAAPQRTPAASRQSPAEAARTLATLRRVDDLPLYAMTYEGAYDRLTNVAVPPAPSPFGCSLFVASGDAAHPLFGRNFDWEPHAALVLTTRPPDGYASMSIVDISYLGFDADQDPTGDRRLLDAPLLPFDGMNERGLAVGLAADESARADTDPARPTVGGVRILRLVLDQASTVDEAVALVRRYNLDFDGGPPLHYLFADAGGASAVVEFVDGRLVVVPGGPPWQALTNFRLAGSDAATRADDRRYATAAGRLQRTGGTLDWSTALDLLRNVAQPHTRWSVTYELRTRVAHVVTDQKWDRVHEFSLAG